MKIIASPRDMQRQIEALRMIGETIGFVPTMGALHEGHLELVRRARKENSQVVVSIFVNPLQFRAGEDFEKYPRIFERDCELLNNNNCDLVFAPEKAAMVDDHETTFVEVGKLGESWEGEIRPGHFRGVATIVAKLFNVVRAHRAYFGEKDFQQLKIIEALARDLNFGIEIVPCETIRENDGLALSSRNAYLNIQDRAAAPTIFQALCAAQKLASDGESSAQKISEAIQEIIDAAPRLQREYSVVVDAQTLEPLETLTHKKPARALIAARAGSTRLIDNAALNLFLQND